MADTRLSDEQLAEIRAREPIEIATNHHITIGGYLGTQEAAQVHAMLADRAALLAEVERLRAALEQEQREHANCEGVNTQRFQTLTDTIIDLTQQVTAMRPMVEAVAEATHAGGNSTVAYISDLLIHQARAYLAAHPAGEAS